MEKIGTYTFVAEPYLTDFRGKATLPMIGNYLIHAASAHAASRGFGFSDMSEQHTAWVLSRLAVEMQEYPAAGDKIVVNTWIDEVARLFTSRCFELCDEQGNVYGFARSIWAAIDKASRRPTVLDEARLRAYLSDRPCPIDRPGKILAAESESHTDGCLCSPVSYTVKYSDLDINGHLNSIKYIEHLLDLFGKEKFENQDIQRLEIAYQAEGRYGMDLSLYKKEISEDRFALAICHDGKSISRAMVVWK